MKNKDKFESETSLIIEHLIKTSKYAPLCKSDFMIALLKGYGLEKPAILKELDVKKHTTQKDADFTYRIINYWQKEGLLNEEEGRERGWRKLSAIEIGWLSIIKSLRDFGVPIKDIKKVKEKMFSLFIAKPFNYTMTWLEYAIYRSVLDKGHPLYLLVFKNGEMDVLDRYDYNLISTMPDFPSQYIKIDLNKLFSEIFRDEQKFETQKLIAQSITKEEYSILDSIRREDPETITIERRRMQGIDFRSTIKTSNTYLPEHLSKPLGDFIKDIKYGAITIKVQDGKAVFYRFDVAQKLEK